MFSSGQLIFALFFLVAFTIVMIYLYRKDLNLHKVHYKNVSLVILAVFAVIAIFTWITFSMH